jgi:phage shock protein E
MKLLLALVLSTLTSLSFAQALLLDARTQAEFDSGHAQGAILMPYDEVKTQAPMVLKDKNQEIKVYCRSGNRAGKAVNTLKSLGYTNVTNIGGLDDARALQVQ